MLQEPKDLGRRLEMAWTVTSPATVTQPVAHALDAPNGRSDYPLVRPAPLSPRKSDRAVTRAIERLSDLRLTATVVRVDLACGPVSCRDLAMTLRSDMLLAEHRPGVGLVVLYIGPRPAGPNCEATVEARIGQELTRVLLSEQRYDLLSSARVAMVHQELDLMTDGLLDVALRAADSIPLVDLLPQAA